MSAREVAERQVARQVGCTLAELYQREAQSARWYRLVTEQMYANIREYGARGACEVRTS
jgi:hypothetical protein